MRQDFVLYAPICKINQEKRTVAGWATTEQLDKQHEIVDYNGSKEAFANWQGNIREMHEPKAIGKAVEIIPNDPEKKIWVEAYISKGAEDTWQKINENILTGFSIGGQTVSKTVQIVKDMDTGGQRTVNRITKYKLNELSLVDNPANPGCTFTLVKSVDGVSYQTEIVEDIKKILISEAEDPLKAEIQEHRDKADSLAKKVLDHEELDKLDDDDFGLIRKYHQGDTIVKERLIPMPDKVHTVRALAILDKYNLNEKETQTIHKKAQQILGSAYESHKIVKTEEGINEMSKEAIDKLIEAISSLTKRMEELEKAFEGAYKPVPGSKETPKESTYDPNLKETAPEQAGVADNVQTQPAEGNIPAKKAVDGNITDAPEVKPPAPKEAGAADDVKTQAEAPKVVEATKEAEAAVKPLAPIQSGAADEVKTQEEAPSVKDENALKPSSPTEAGAADAVQTQPAEGAYPAKGPIKVEKCVEEVKKSDSSENDLSKLASAVESLRKRVDEVNEKLSRPMPRKIKIEKNLDESTTEDTELRKLAEEVKKWTVSGKALTAEQMKIQQDVLNKMLEAKFGKSL
jgi:hypothetical protein